MKKLVGILVVLMCVGLAQGAIFNDMGDSGQFSRDTLAMTTAPGSYWSSHVSSNAQVTMVNDGGTAPSNYVQMAIQWYPRAANMWYVDAFASEVDEAWTVSADVAAVLGSQNGNRYMRVGTCTSPGLFDPWDFQMDFRYMTNTIDWIAGSQSGSTSIPGMSTAWTEAEISYDAATGAAVGTFGGVEVFNVTIDAGITVNSVFFSRYNNGSTYDTGKMLVDNVTATSVPEPATMIMIALGGLGLLRKRNA